MRFEICWEWETVSNKSEYEFGLKGAALAAATPATTTLSDFCFGRNDNKERRYGMKSYASIIGAFLGGAVGSIVGVSLHQPAVWLPLGIGIGLSIGIEIKDRQKRHWRC
jgi:uncharacterized membrane protein YoaK (UPF0700 family)